MYIHICIFFFSEAVPFPFFELVPSCNIFRRKKKKTPECPRQLEALAIETNKQKKTISIGGACYYTNNMHMEECVNVHRKTAFTLPYFIKRLIREGR